MSYANENEVALAVSLGYEVSCDQNNGHRFARGDRRIWAIKDGWQTSDLVRDLFTNHKPLTDLSEALNRE